MSEHRHLPGWRRVAGAGREHASGDLERHLLHRPREVHRVCRFLRPRGVRGGLPGRLLRARPETEGVLLERARALHPDKTIPDDAPSRFRKEGGAPAGNGHDTAATAAMPATTPAPAPAAAPAPARPAAAPAAAKPAAAKPAA